jgi:hypothetical protein
LNQGRVLRKSRNLRIAGVTFAIHTDPAVRLRLGNSLYLPFFSGKPGNESEIKIDVRLRFDGFPSWQRLEEIFDTGESWRMYRDGRSHWIVMAPPKLAEPLWIARFDRQAGRVTVYGRSILPTPGKKKIDQDLPICYPLDQLLLMFFLAARRGILTHAAGVARNGKAFLFAGASGAGKSTFSQLLAAAKVGKLLSDERMIVREIAGTMQAFGTPWAGTAGIARNGQAPLAGIYFLKHGRSNHIEKIEAAAALEKFLPLVSIPWFAADDMSLIVSFTKRILARIPAFEMSFKPDRSAVDCFWKFQKSASRSV